VTALTANAAASTIDTQPGWRAHLDLSFRHAAGRSRMYRGESFGPLYVQKPFYPEGELVHVYLLHPPGGVAGGDQLKINISAEDRAGALLTTPAANKFYRSAGLSASVQNVLSVGTGASLEWLPQENLFFGNCAVKLDTRVRLAPGARFISWDLNCFGRPASGDYFIDGDVSSSTGIYRAGHTAADDQPILFERNCWQAGSELMSAAWGLSGQGVVGTLYATPVDDEQLAFLRRSLAAYSSADSQFALTSVGNLLIARILTDSSILARKQLVEVWQALRPLVLGRSASPPRIWST
jgi:urease accessory protein